MNFIKAAYDLVIDSLFPLSKAEEELLALAPEQALDRLPPAPPYDASVASLPGARSVWAYKDERVSRLVWNIKYKKSDHSVALGGFALYKALQNEPAGAILVPMPITPRRRRERGYNQCELLTDELARLDVDERFIFKKDLVARVQHTSHQKLKDRKARLEVAKGLFAVNEKEAQSIDEGTQIIVIDDVITTGSTMKEAIDTFKSAGFLKVKALSLAH